MKDTNKVKTSKKPGRWLIFKKSYKQLSEEDVSLLNDENNEGICTINTNGKKESKKFIKQASKRVKKATWSALKAMYQGFLYSSHMNYSSSMPGMDPMFMPHTRTPTYYYKSRFNY